MKRRFWFNFKQFDTPTPLNLGCGVTADSLDGAIQLLRSKVFLKEHFEIVQTIEDVEISSLDEGHIRPNMGNPMMLGIWFPLGYE